MSRDRNSSMFTVLTREPWAVWVGLRYLRSKKNSKFLSLITAISIGGVALGVAALLIVLSVMDGFEEALKGRLLSSELHVLVTPGPGLAGAEQGRISEASPEVTRMAALAVAHPDVVSVTPILSTEGVLRSGKRISGVEFKGVDSRKLERVRDWAIDSAQESLLFEESDGVKYRIPGVWVGQELALELGLIPGDRVTLISPTEREGPAQSIPRMRRFVVEGVYRLGLPEIESKTVFTDVENVRSFLRRAGSISAWEINLKSLDHASKVQADLQAQAPEFTIRSWKDLNSHLFYSLKLERLAMFVILGFIVIVASFNIVTTLTLMVMEKKREISILKAIGATHEQVAAIFLAEGLMIGGTGTFAGSIFGGVVCLLLSRYEFIQLPEIYYDRTLPVNFDPMFLIWTVCLTLVVVILACLYPSRRAAKLLPLDGLRFG